jgi:hypothetical protein
MMGLIKLEVISMKVKRGDRLTDWQQGQTFYVARQGTQDGRTILVDEDGGFHQLDDCQAPSEDYERPLSSDEVALLVAAIEEELSDDARELNNWLSLLSQPQKRQVWMALHPHAREELKLAAKQDKSQEVA